MAEILVSDLLPGLPLASSVYLPTNHNVPLINVNKSGYILSESDINSLKTKGVPSVEISLENSEYTFPREFVSQLARVIDTFYQKNDIGIIISYARLFDTLCRDESGNYRTDFTIDTDKYVCRNDNGENPYKTTGEHIANVTCMAVAIVSVYNSNKSSKDMIPVEDMALAAMLSEVGRYANIATQLESLKNSYKDSSLIRNIEKAVYLNNTMFYQMNGGKTQKPVLTRIQDSIFETYNYKYIPLYSYLLCKKFDLRKSIVSRGILYSGENYSNTDGILGVALEAIKSPDTDNMQDDTNLGTKSCVISEIIRMCSLYDLALYTSRENCEANNIMPMYRDVFTFMNRKQDAGWVHPGLLKYLYKIVPCYYVGQVVELNDGSFGRVYDNRDLDLADPAIEDMNGTPISDNVVILGPHTDSPYVFMDVPSNTKSAVGL